MNEWIMSWSLHSHCEVTATIDSKLASGRCTYPSTLPTLCYLQNIVAISSTNMTNSLELPTTIAALRNKATAPYELGLACGQLVKSIKPLVSEHLYGTLDHHNRPPHANIDTVGFTIAVDAYLRRQRIADGVTAAFDDTVVDHKKMKEHKKYLARCTKKLEDAYKAIIVRELQGIFSGYNTTATQLFNKGVHYALRDFTWTKYPAVNVAIEARNEDWFQWLEKRCEELNKEFVKRGERGWDP